MPHWGMSLALGTNINDTAPADRLKQAYTHLAEAQARAAGSEVEQALIAALAKRYVADPTGDQMPREQAYSDAMGALAKKFPDDLDVATLYAESLMNLRPWRLYERRARRSPAPTDRRDARTRDGAHPNHPGANHYYIHAVEASKKPDRALPQAERLETLVPGAGHLVHMPAHIYIRTGQYANSAKSNADAARVDESTSRTPASRASTRRCITATTCSSNPRRRCLRATSRRRVRPRSRRSNWSIPLAMRRRCWSRMPCRTARVALRFGRWDEALTVKAPASRRARSRRRSSHYVRGAALAEQGKLDEAGARAGAQAAAAGVPEDLMISATNRGRALLDVAAADLDGRIATARNDTPSAVAAFTRAVDAEDWLLYNEPPDWLLPERERLGAALLAAGRAPVAESVFRKDLERNVANPRSLFGLWKALESQKKPEAAEARAAFESAWKSADVTLDAGLHGAPR